MSEDSNPSFVLRALKDVAIENIPEPKTENSHDVAVRIAETGIWMSDVHYWQKGRIGDFILTAPIVLRHESSGTVIEIGSAVKNLKFGDRVPCRHCDVCRSGSYNLSPDTVFAATPPQRHAVETLSLSTTRTYAI